MPTSCHRNGRCHECVVEVTRGEDALNARTEAESFLCGRYRLACQAVVARADRDVAFAPPHRRPRILAAPDRGAPRAFDPLVTRRGEEVLYDGAPIDRYRGRILGLAVDLGTTTVVLDFVDLESGRSVHGAAFENPQAFGGSDVMHRISYDREDATGALQKAAAEACARLDVGRNALYEIVRATRPCATSSSSSTSRGSARGRTNPWWRRRFWPANGPIPRSARRPGGWACGATRRPAPTACP